MIKEQNIALQQKLLHLTEELESKDKSMVEKIRSLRQENNIKANVLKKNDNNIDSLQGKELLINYCALLKDLNLLKNKLTINEVDHVSNYLNIFYTS